MKVLAIATNGFEETELIGTVDKLTRFGHDVTMAFSSDKPYVQSGHSIKLVVEKTIKGELKNLDQYDALFIPGGIGTKKLGELPETAAILAHFFGEDKFVGAICAAPSLLAPGGYLKGKDATVYPSKEYEKLLKDNGANLNPDLPSNFDKNKVIVYVDGKLITGNNLDATFRFAEEFAKILKK